VDILDEVRKIADSDAVVADMRCDDIGSESEQGLVGAFVVGHNSVFSIYRGDDDRLCGSL
jgi:hypothetical protein